MVTILCPAFREASLLIRTTAPQSLSNNQVQCTFLLSQCHPAFEALLLVNMLVEGWLVSVCFKQWTWLTMIEHDWCFSLQALDRMASVWKTYFKKSQKALQLSHTMWLFFQATSLSVVVPLPICLPGAQLWRWLRFLLYYTGASVRLVKHLTGQSPGRICLSIVAALPTPPFAAQVYI